jgi:hypothetical protein
LDSLLGPMTAKVFRAPQVERVNRVTTTSLASTNELPDGSDWNHHLEYVQWNTNNTYHQATTRTTQRNINRSNIGNALSGNTSTSSGVSIEMRSVAAIDWIEEDKRKPQIRYNKKQKSTDEYQHGDIVLVKQDATVGGNRKLQKLPYDRIQTEYLCQKNNVLKAFIK